MAGWKGFGASVFSECVVDRLVTNQVCPEKSKPGREKAWKWSLDNVECCPGEEGLLCFVGFQVLWAEAPRGQGSALPREVVATMRQVTSQEKSGVGLEVLPLKFLYKKKNVGFPGGAVVENLPANAGDTGSSPGLGRSRMPRSSWGREPQLLSLRLWSPCSATREAAIVRGPRTAMKSGPRLPQLEKALAQKRRPNTAKNKNK